MARQVIRLQIQDRANKTVLTFYSWDTAHNHIRQVILGGIVEELVDVAKWGNSDDKTEALEDLEDIAKEINYPRDQAALEEAVKRWQAYVAQGAPYTTVEIL